MVKLAGSKKQFSIEITRINVSEVRWFTWEREGQKQTYKGRSVTDYEKNHLVNTTEKIYLKEEVNA
jgi:hypothetical protein